MDYYDLARIYLRSRAVPPLLTATLRPFQELANGTAEQQYEFALRWRDGQGLPRSRTGYLNWLEHAAFGDYPPALHEYGKRRLAGEIGTDGEEYKL